MKHCPAALLFIMMSGSTLSYGQEGSPPASSFVSDGSVIEVLAEQSSEEALRSSESGLIQVIEVKGESEGRALSEVLSSAVGVQVQSLGGLGHFAQVTIRGSSADQVAIYVDGVPVQRAVGGAVNLADYSLAQVERIEIYRGMVSSSLPGMPAGGAINIITRKVEKTQVDSALTVGSFGTQEAKVMTHYQGKGLGLTIVGDLLRSNGDFTYLDNNGTPENAEDDEWVERLNNDFQQGSGHLRLNATHFDVDLDYFAAERGIAGTGSVQSETAHFAVRRYASQVSLAQIHPSERISVQGSADWRLLQERFSDVGGTVGLGRRDVQGNTQDIGLNVSGTMLLTPWWVTSIGVAPRHQQFEQLEFYPEELSLGRYERQLVDGSWSMDFSVFDNRLWLTPDVRALYINDLDSTLQTETAQALRSSSGGFRAQPWRGMWLRGSVFSGYRAPSFYELYGDRGTIIGNPELAPESVSGFEGGISWERQDGAYRLFVEGAGFYKEAENLIQYVQNSQKTSEAINISEASLAGLEFRGSLAFERLQTSANYTYLNAIDRSDIPYYQGNQLPRRPKHEAYLSVGSCLHRHLSLSSDFRYISPTYLDLANFKLTQQRLLWSAGLESPWRDEALSFTFRVENLLGIQVSDFDGYPLPGRAFFMSLAYDFQRSLEGS